MSITLWIVLAFVLGFLFGRLSARGASANRGGPTSFDSTSGPAIGTRSRPASPAPAAPAGNPSGAYTVTLIDHGPNLINTIKAIREVTRFDLRTSKEAAESAPRELIRVDSPEQAHAIAQRFQGIATVRVDGSPAGQNYAGFSNAPGAPPQSYR